jgi:hypothetical protein
VDVEVDSLHVKRIGIEDLVSYVYIVKLDSTLILLGNVLTFFFVQVISVKALGTSLKLTFEGTNQLVYPETWYFMLVVATCVLTQMNYLNKVCTTCCKWFPFS